MRVRFYVTASGRSPVEEFISLLPERLRAAILVSLEKVIEFGFQARGLSFRKIEGKLWELRIQSGGSVRLFYIVLPEYEERTQKGTITTGQPPAVGEVMIVLHAYQKQTQRAPIHELDVARKRLKEVSK